MDKRMLLKEIVKLFIDDKSMRVYCGITEPEVNMCKEVLVEDKSISELAAAGNIKRSQVKKMAYAPFLKVINKVYEQLPEQGQLEEVNVSNGSSAETGNDRNTGSELEGVTVDNFSISERTRKVLKENGITNIEKLAELDFEELKLNGNYGVKTIFELQQLAGKLKDSRDILSILRKCGK
ncbi:MAG: hypothetical protein JSV22_12740 [Bacteroidales bacterium]|nr:MAG: hypothetical protein JSV22_12740 [Bacteroidales bacterium]